MEVSVKDQESTISTGVGSNDRDQVKRTLKASLEGELVDLRSSTAILTSRVTQREAVTIIAVADTATASSILTIRQKIQKLARLSIR